MEFGYFCCFFFAQIFCSVRCLEETPPTSPKLGRIRQRSDASFEEFSPIKFRLYVNDYNSEFLRLADAFTLSISQFDPSKPTKVLIHGWMDAATGRVITPLVQGFLNRNEDLNVLAVDWSNISINLDYLNIAMRTEKVGKEVAQMIDFLVEQGAKLEDFHLIGHSLGAHVAGYASRSLKSGRLTRITGLDPALAGFGAFWIAKRLTKADAEFVDCIHTCGGTLGTLEPHCHADFYPNGGMCAQPGCPLFDMGMCSHNRAADYYAESLLPDHKFTTLFCGSYYNEPQKCERSTHLMGYPVDTSANGTYYVDTNSRYPFAPVNPAISFVENMQYV